MLKKNSGFRLENAKSAVSSLLASLICILIGLFIGFVVLFVLGWVTVSQKGSNAGFAEMLRITWEQGFSRLLEGGFYKFANIIPGMGVAALPRREQIHVACRGNIVAVRSAGVTVAQKAAASPVQSTAAMGTDQKRAEIHKNLTKRQVM